MTLDQWTIFNENVMQIYALSDWLYHNRKSLEIPEDAVQSIIRIRGESVKMTVKLSDMVERPYP
jgi:hypothetical protein